MLRRHAILFSVFLGLAGVVLAAPVAARDFPAYRSHPRPAPVDTLAVPKNAGGSKAAAGPEKTLSISFRTETDSNPFRMKDSWRDGFEGMRSTGERFSGYEAVSDQAVRLDVSGGLSWRTRTLREIGIEAGVGYRTFLRNGFADQFDIEAGVNVRPSKKARTSVDLDWTPSRFRANYVSESSALAVFAPAHASDLGLRLRHRQKLSESVDLAADAEVEWRRYEEAFIERNRRVLSGRLLVRFEPARKLQLEFGLNAGHGDTTEDGALIDRSFDQVGGEADVSGRIGAWRPGVSVDVRRRSYSTSDETDFTRFGRVDTRWRIGLYATRPVARGVSLLLGADYTDKTSNRPGDPLDPEVVPYGRYRARIGITADLGGR